MSYPKPPTIGKYKTTQGILFVEHSPIPFSKDDDVHSDDVGRWFVEAVESSDAIEEHSFSVEEWVAIEPERIDDIPADWPV